MNYITCCVDSTAELINNMTDQAREITYRTLLKYITLDHILEIFPIYERTKKLGLTIENDWAVSYYKSKYNGCACVYIQHSCIEYVFI